MIKKLSSIILLMFLGAPVFACYGAGCSTYYGGTYDLPWKLFHKTVPIVYTNPTAILDNPEKYINYSISANSKGNISQNINTKKGSIRITKKKFNKYIIKY